jgi:hypothetical protein
VKFDLAHSKMLSALHSCNLQSVERELLQSALVLQAAGGKDDCLQKEVPPSVGLEA